jgi:hypothetical protein
MRHALRQIGFDNISFRKGGLMGTTNLLGPKTAC